MKYYELQYDREKELLLFPVKEEKEGTGVVTGYVGRNFGPSAPLRKYLYFGNRGLPPIIASPEAKNNVGVFVEDMVSAIKVGRSYCALPVLSANIATEALKWASKTFNYVGVWLDRDMHGKSSRTAFKGSLLGGAKFFPVYTPGDPKEYSSIEQQQIIKEALNFLV